MTTYQNLSLNSIPPELHFEICKYLGAKSRRSLSYTSQQLRQIYHAPLYQHIGLNDRFTQNPDNWFAEDEFSRLTHIWVDTFNFPERYSWFPNTVVKYIRLERSFVTPNSLCHKKELLTLYPRIKYIGYKSNSNIIGESYVDDIHDLYIGSFYLSAPPQNVNESRLTSSSLDDAIAFANYLPFLRSLAQSSPPPLIYTKELVEASNKLICRAHFMHLISNFGYWNSESVEYEQQLNNFLQSVQENDYGEYPSSPFYGPFVFPKPSWTDFLSFLSVSLVALKNQVPKGYGSTLRYFKPHSYCSLEKLVIKDEEAKPFQLSGVAYASLGLCKKLRDVKIRYISHSRQSRQVLSMINRIKVNRNSKFSLECGLGVVGIRDPKYCLTNTAITDVTITRNISVERNNRFLDDHRTDSTHYYNNIEINLHFDVLQSFSCQLYSYRDRLFRYIINYKDSLVTLNIKMYYNGWETNAISSTISRSTFPKLKFLNLIPYDDSPKTDALWVDEEHIFKNFSQLIRFGEPPETIGQAVELFKSLYSLVSQIHLSEPADILEIPRVYFLFESFFQCYDSTIKGQCCEQASNPELLSGLYCLFVFLLSKLSERYSSSFIGNAILKVTKLDVLLAAFSKSTPALESLHITMRNVRVNRLFIMCYPNLQKLLRSHPNLQSFTFGESLSSSSIFIPDVWREQDEWLSSKVIFRGCNMHYNELFINKI